MLKTGLLMVPKGGCILLNGFRIQVRETAVEDCECSDHSCTGCTDENMHKVSKTVSEDYQITILKIAGRSGFLFGTCQ